MDVFLLLLIGGVAGFVNVLSAGGSMLTLPLLMFLGLPPQQANATNRVAIVLQSVTAVTEFRRTGHGNAVVSGMLAIPAIAGALPGAWLASRVPDPVFQAILVVIMVTVSVFMLLPQPQPDTRPLTRKRLGPGIWLAMFVIGLYGGFIQVGVGALFLVILHRILKIDLPQVNVLKVAIILLYTLPALLIFAFNGQVRWGMGLILAAGNIAGAWVAVRVNLGRRGALWVKWLTLAMVAAILVRLLLF